jgi:alpha-N-acetylglucosaminidase
LLFKRPTAKIIGFQGHPGDTEKLGRALDMLLKETGEYKQAPLFLHDLVDFSRHYITLTIDSLLIEMVRSYQENDPDRGDLLTSKILTLVEGVDLLLGTQPESLTTWLGAAQKYAPNAAESAYYVRNAKT